MLVSQPHMFPFMAITVGRRPPKTLLEGIRFVPVLEDLVLGLRKLDVLRDVLHTDRHCRNGRKQTCRSETWRGKRGSRISSEHMLGGSRASPTSRLALQKEAGSRSSVGQAGDGACGSTTGGSYGENPPIAPWCMHRQTERPLTASARVAEFESGT